MLNGLNVYVADKVAMALRTPISRVRSVTETSMVRAAAILLGNLVSGRPPRQRG
jgi:hypothetical protein